MNDNDDGALLLKRWSEEQDREAAAALITRHERMLYNLAYRMLGNVEDTRDATQETFLRALMSASTFRGEAQFVTWLYRIAKNTCLARLRHAHGECIVLEDDALETIPSSALTPDEETEQADTASVIHRLIDELPETYRFVLTLYYLQEFSYRQIADILELPIGTVKVHLFRAKQILKERLQQALSC